MIRSVSVLGALALATGLVWAQETAAPVQGPQEPAAPAIVKLSTLPLVLDHDATFEDAKADAKGVRRSVLMGGLDKITARTFKFEAPVGATVTFKKLLIAARTCHVRPPEETPETSVFVDVAEATPEGGEDLHRLFSGWMFASSPGLNALEHPVYDVWVIGCRIDDPNNPEASTTIAGQEEEGPAEKPSIDDEIQSDDAARE